MVRLKMFHDEGTSKDILMSYLQCCPILSHELDFLHKTIAYGVTHFLYGVATSDGVI